MNKPLIHVAFAAIALLAGNAFAADCATQATEKKLAGAAKTSFMKKCEKDAAPPANEACMKAAADKKLAGAAKASFVKKCEKDGVPTAKMSCVKEAGDKKLAGAAKDSFMKKCEADASAAPKA